MQAIKFDNVSFSYKEESDDKGNQSLETSSYKKEPDVIDNLSLEIEEGEFVAMVGKNGSGKSTIAKLVNALILPKSGEVTVFGLKTSDKKSLFDIRKSVGMVFQNPDNQMVATIVEDDIAFGPENIGIERKEIAERIGFALEATGTEKFRSRPSDQLSGGQKQRVAIAGVLAIRPRILILDEATSMLDPAGRDEVNAVIRKLNKEHGLTVITVTHYMEEAFDADRIIVIDEGKMVFGGSPREVFSHERELLKCGLALPRAAYIFARLKERRIIPSKEQGFTPEELEKALCRYLVKT